MDLLEKLNNVEVKIIDRFPPEDMEYCRQAEKDYQSAYNIYSEFAYIVEETNEQIRLLSDIIYTQTIDEHKDKVVNCNEWFISKICGYFGKKYAVTVEAPSWKIYEEDKWGDKYKIDCYDAVSLQYILDSIYEQMGGMSFEEKAFTELKEDARESIITYNGKPKYRIQGLKLIIDEFYRSHKDGIWERYMASIEKKHRSFFKALTHFEYGYYDISQKYNFLCDYRLDENNGVYDKHIISSLIINSIRVYKNGKVEIDFKDYKTVIKFMDTYFPGIPQSAAE